MQATIIPLTRRAVLKVNSLLPDFLFLFGFIIKSVEMPFLLSMRMDNSKCVIAQRRLSLKKRITEKTDLDFRRLPDGMGNF